MTNNDTRGLKNDPNDSTVRPQGQRRDVTADDEFVGQNEDQAGAGEPLDEYEYGKHNNPAEGTPDDLPQEVYDYLIDTYDGQAWPTSTDIASEFVDSASQVGRAMGALASAEDCPIDVERWSANNTTPARWMIEVPEQGDEQPVVTDGGTEIADADRLREAIKQVQIVRDTIQSNLNHRPDQDSALAKAEYQLRGVADELEERDQDDESGGDDLDPHLMTDGGQRQRPDHHTDLTRFQVEILYTLAAEGACHGLGVKDELEAYYEKRIQHGQLYPNLDTLVDADLVAKSSVDGRTNEYRLTTDGRVLIKRDAHRRQGIADALHENTELKADGGDEA